MFDSTDSYATRFDSTNHWLPYHQEVPNPYILAPGGFEDTYKYIRESTVNTILPKELCTKKGSNTRAKTVKKVTQKRKLRKSVNQLDVLRKFFKTNPKPGRDSVAQLAEATGLKFLEVRNWFRNARLRNKGDMTDDYVSKEEDNDSIGFGEVSSSTGHPTAVSFSDEILRIWEYVDEKEKMELVPKMFDYWERNSNDRNDAIKQILKCLSPQERSFVQNYVKPRGPYRCSGDKTLSKTTILERAKNAWRELERIFGANKRVDKSMQDGYQDSMSLDLNLDRDMLEGLKSLFQAHRDYLYYLSKEMGIDTADDKDIDKLKSSSMSRVGYVTSDPGTISTDLIPQHNQIGGHMDLFPSYTQTPLLPNGPCSIPCSYNSSYPLIPAAPTPIYPTSCNDYIPYSYNNPVSTAHHYPATSPMQNMMVGGLPSPTTPFNRSPWVQGPVPQDDRNSLKPYYNPEPDYSFVKNHFSPEKLTTPHPNDGKNLIKPFSELGSIGFNYNTTHNDNTEITQKCTFVKYYEVTYNNKSGGAQGNPGTHLPLPPPNPGSKTLEQLN